MFEVATFYAHFDVVKEDETPPPSLTIRVCDSLSCELAGAEQLQQALEGGLDPSQVRVVRAPCMGRCDTAPVLEIGHKQGKELSKYLNLNGFNQTKIYKDLSGKDRCLISTKNQ